jgi:hypothetical protein
MSCLGAHGNVTDQFSFLRVTPKLKTYLRSNFWRPTFFQHPEESALGGAFSSELGSRG